MDDDELFNLVHFVELPVFMHKIVQRELLISHKTSINFQWSKSVSAEI